MRSLLTVGVLLFLLPGAEAGSKEPGAADVAMQFYQMANQGKCAEAEALFTPESVRLINNSLGSTDGFLRFCTGRGGKAAIRALTVGKEERKGNRAQVMIERSYEDGSLAFERDHLVKVGGKWRLTVEQRQ